MLKLLLIIFIIIPLGIWIGTMIANLVSLILMFIAVAVGGFAHNLFKHKKEVKWQAPEYVGVVQYLIIYGLLISVYANVIGSSFNWTWLTGIGGVLQYVFISLLALDLLVLVILATIHGPFEIMEN